jgi:hypothetical protein
LSKKIVDIRKDRPTPITVLQDATAKVDQIESIIVVYRTQDGNACVRKSYMPFDDESVLAHMVELNVLKSLAELAGDIGEDPKEPV